MRDDKTETTSGDKTQLLPFKRRKQLERDLEHITEEMYRRNRELAQTNKTLSLLRTIDALVLESHASLKMVCSHITEAITQATEYAFVGLMTRSSHTADQLTLNGWSGSTWLGKNEIHPLFARPVHLEMTHEWFTTFESTRAVSLEKESNESLAQLLDCKPAEVAHFREAVDIKTVYLIKLFARRHLVGVLIVGFQQPVDELVPEDTQLMDRISESIGVALDNKLLFDENQSVLRQLRESNAKLRALDEAKDDFISMASHQLRTPLTSVKGYISMVMEGDAGKVNPQQKTMLTQAYFSSQRMVYLIADLLNVSRLRTGKFIIESAPVNLANLVEEEISQLVEMAKNNELDVIYHKPKDFPTLMLDDTKTRQAIMNFIDNAIYYTPKGGSIKIELEEKASTIELRVVDSGIGVPKSEQPHLFTKFYRAGNARKARPNGTGLGLFMAKKVIVGQGGSIIFESREGKGSTFGFILSKTKLAVPEKAAETPEKPLETKT
jgi:signal transduction histidine kinase